MRSIVVWSGTIEYLYSTGILLSAVGVRSSFQKVGLLAGGLLIAFTSLLLIVAWHFGVNPHHR